MFMCNISYCLYINKVNTRVTNGLDINSFSVFINSCFEFFQIIWVYEFSVNTQTWQCSSEQVISTTVQCRSRYDIITSTCNIQYGICNRCGTRCYSNTTSTTFKLSYTSIQHICSRIAKARINATRISQSKTTCCFFCIFKYERCSLVNRHCTRTCWIYRLTGM